MRSDIPEATRPQVERVILAPLTLLYPDSSHKPVIALTISEYRNEKVRTAAGGQVDLSSFYDAAFAGRVKPYQPLLDDRRGRFSPQLMAVPGRHRAVDRRQSRPRGPGPLPHAPQIAGRELRPIKPGLGPDEPIKGLTEERQQGRFRHPLHIVRHPQAER